MIDKDFITLMEIASRLLRRLEADGCEGCKYQDKESWEMPCSDCKNTHVSHWKGADYKKAEGEPIPQWRGCMDGCLPFSDGGE